MSAKGQQNTLPPARGLAFRAGAAEEDPRALPGAPAAVESIEMISPAAAVEPPRRTLTILYHHRTQGHGAEGVHITGIINGFRKAGHRVVHSAPPGVNPFQTAGSYLYSPKKSFINKIWKRVSQSAPQVLFELLELGYNHFQHARLKALLEREQVDFIYERYAFFLWVTAALARQRDIPFILEVNEISGIKRARPLVLSGLAKRIEKRVFLQADRIVTVSSFLKRKIAEMGVPEEKIIVMPNGVDAETFIPRSTRRAVRERLGLADACVVGFVGWIDPWDNLPGLLRVFRELADRRPDLRLLLIGDVVGKGVSRAPVEKMIADLRLGDKVKIVPRVPRTEIPDHIGAMDVCLIPDSNPFGSPVVLFEFMAMARPVVAPSVAPVLDVIAHGDNGMVFEAHDPASLRDTLWSVVEDAPLRERLGRRARECIDRRHTWDNNARAVLAAYGELASSGRGA